MARLAVNGGEPTVKRTLGRPWPIFDEEDEKALLEVLRSGKWWRGAYEKAADSKVGQLEDAFAAYQHAKYGIAVTNGTQALECALKATGVGPGDEVIVPALTFIATATAVVLVNAVPVIVDVDPASYNISPEAVEAAITPRTKAIIPVHNGGYPCDMDRLMEIASKHNLFVVEDCAHAHGSEWRGRRLGSIGHLGCFSFQMGKTLTCGEGGIVLTSDSGLAEKAYSLMHIGRVSGRPFYEFHRFASNMRMTEFQAALLLSQLSRLDEQVEARERNTAYLAKGLREIEGVKPISRDPRVTRWCFYYWNFKYHEDRFDGILRDRFLEALRAEGVPCSVGAHGEPIYHHPVFKNTTWDKCPFHRPDLNYGKVYCTEAERIYRHEACSFPHRLFLGDESDMGLVLEAIRKIRDNTDELKQAPGGK